MSFQLDSSPATMLLQLARPQNIPPISLGPSESNSTDNLPHSNNNNHNNQNHNVPPPANGPINTHTYLHGPHTNNQTQSNLAGSGLAPLGSGSGPGPGGPLGNGPGVSLSSLGPLGLGGSGSHSVGNGPVILPHNQVQGLSSHNQSIIPNLSPLNNNQYPEHTNHHNLLEHKSVPIQQPFYPSSNSAPLVHLNNDPQLNLIPSNPLASPGSSPSGSGSGSGSGPGSGSLPLQSPGLLINHRSTSVGSHSLSASVSTPNIVQPYIYNHSNQYNNPNNVNNDHTLSFPSIMDWRASVDIAERISARDRIRGAYEKLSMDSKLSLNQLINLAASLDEELAFAMSRSRMQYLKFPIDHLAKIKYKSAQANLNKPNSTNESIIPKLESIQTSVKRERERDGSIDQENELNSINHDDQSHKKAKPISSAPTPQAVNT